LAGLTSSAIVTTTGVTSAGVMTTVGLAGTDATTLAGLTSSAIVTTAGVTSTAIITTTGLSASAAITGGTVFAGTVDCSSDLRFKRNVTVLTAERARALLDLQGVTWQWRQDEFPERHFGNETRFGFIAQDVEKVFPELVRRGEDGFFSLQVGGLEPLLAQAHRLHDERIVVLENDDVLIKNDNIDQAQQIAELQQEVQALRKDNTALFARLEALESRFPERR